MKKLIVAMLLLATPVTAAPIILGPGPYTSTNWNMSTPMFWNNTSYDRNGQANIGYYLSGTGASDVPSFWSGSPLNSPASYGGVDTRWGWTGDLLIRDLQNITGWDDSFGVYDLVSGEKQTLGSAWVSETAIWTVPCTSCGFWLLSGEGHTWYSGSTSFDGRSHFAMFGDGQGNWYLGIEDATYSTQRTADWDYNDVILQLNAQPVPESGGFGLLLVGFTLLLTVSKFYAKL